MEEPRCREQMDDGFTARRLRKLSKYQVLNGCLNKVQAQDEGELWLLSWEAATLASSSRESSGYRSTCCERYSS
ncbi:hypothetical protein E1264_18040 [Actinomadura sp. KC216]|uniref:hypothetical protein n=1 Tax=Actinomadura sp. KC216 TaxID=2530370 RepID=UPI001044C56C|nr:hypothetical protein [Actinomadura sp. KC216]TDB86405.1 hypothetical protein E1264_18040 [Actinomadura sp. KC216]